jgi:putative bacteriocin precursor
MKKLGKNMKNTKQTLEAFGPNIGICICLCSCNCRGNTAANVQINNGTKNATATKYGKK